MFNVSDRSNYVRSSMFDQSKPKIGCSSSITKRWTCSSFARCSKKWCSNLIHKQFSKSSEGPIRFKVRFSIVLSQKYGVWVWSPIDEHIRIHSIFEKWCLSSFDVLWNGVRHITLVWNSFDTNSKSTLETSRFYLVRTLLFVLSVIHDSLKLHKFDW